MCASGVLFIRKGGDVDIGALLLVTLAWSPASAQEQSGSIQGVVKDAQGAVLPGATVEAKTRSTGAATAVTADASGVYRFPALPPGTYQVSASLQGFQAGRPSEVVVDLGKNFTVDLVLALAGVAEAVTVTAEASPLIDTKGNSASTSMSKETIERMPKGRDFATILRLAPGAQQETKAGNYRPRFSGVRHPDRRRVRF